jgi:ribosomal protein S18 acetylase RimI-like enzyme
MEIREARAEEDDAIRTIARESMAASYAPDIEEATIDAAVTRWYSEESIAEALEDPDTLFLVVEDGGDVVAFSKSVMVDRREPTGEVHWLHVDPDHRGRGVGRQLLDYTETELAARGAVRLAGYVLDVNDVGSTFYEDNGYELAGERRIRVGDRTVQEREYDKFSADDGDAATPLEPVGDPDEETFYADYEEALRGASGEFYPVYRSQDGEERYGWYCGACDSLDVTMDTMERVECNDCGNRSKAARWDAAYL